MSLPPSLASGASPSSTKLDSLGKSDAAPLGGRWHLHMHLVSLQRPPTPPLLHLSDRGTCFLGPERGSELVLAAWPELCVNEQSDF